MALTSGIYRLYTNNKEEMDSRTFNKLCKDSGLIDKRFTSTHCDLLFTKIKGKGKQRITEEIFMYNAIAGIATKKNISQNAVHDAIVKLTGPKFSGTRAQSVRLHDDKSTYTGVHQHGGPSTNDLSGRFNGTFSNYPGDTKGSGITNRITLENLCDRTQPDVRGVNKH